MQTGKWFVRVSWLQWRYLRQVTYPVTTLHFPQDDKPSWWQITWVYCYSVTSSTTAQLEEMGDRMCLSDNRYYVIDLCILFGLLWLIDHHAVLVPAFQQFLKSLPQVPPTNPGSIHDRPHNSSPANTSWYPSGTSYCFHESDMYLAHTHGLTLSAPSTKPYDLAESNSYALGGLNEGMKSCYGGFDFQHDIFWSR